MFEELMPVIVGGAIGISGSIATALFSTYIQSKKEQKNYSRKKHEEIFSEPSEDINIFTEFYLKHLTAIEKGINSNKLKKGEDFSSTLKRKGRISMLIALYSPKIKTDKYYSIKISIVKEINKAHRNASEIKATQGEDLKVLHKEVEEYKKVTSNLLNEVSRQCRKL